MKVFEKIRRHAAVSSGDFAVMFKSVDIPPLPAALTQLVEEINRPEPDLSRIAKLVSSSAGLASKVVRTVNSAMFSVKRPVSNVHQALVLLGLGYIRQIVLAYATMDALPKPHGDFFNHEAFWTDSLLQAILARSLAKNRFHDQLDDVFTATLLADVALPVLLSSWTEYYQPVVDEWRQSSRRLSEIEREHFGWDHAQAGAWIMQSWNFPEEMVCYIGAHNLSWEQIEKYELDETIVVPMAISAVLPSVLKNDGQGRAAEVANGALQMFGISGGDFTVCVAELRDGFAEFTELFGLSGFNVDKIIDDLSAAAERAQESGE